MSEATFRRKHLLGLQDLSAGELTHLLDTAVRFRDINTRRIKKVPTLRGRSVVHLFLEPSTRTRTSFDIAAKRLSADTFSISGASSSMLKGESLRDTAANIEAMRPDIIVIRHNAAGAALYLSQLLECSIINAGDGFHEHPTQGLLDLLTLRDSLGDLAGKRVSIVGDIAHSRVARSATWGLQTLGAEVTLAGPPTLLPLRPPKGVRVAHRLEDAVRGADAVMMLRIQRERIPNGGHRIPSTREYSKLWGLNRSRLKDWAEPHTVLLHPGPVNRGVELSPDVLDGPWSLILNQVHNGVAVRMATMYLVLEGDDEAVD